MPNALARPDPLDRRFNRRVATRARRTVKTQGREISCIVRDRSPGGLRIVFEHHVELEHEFLFIEAGGQTTLRVQLIWTDGRQAGVSILQNG